MSRPMTAAEWRAAFTKWHVDIHYWPNWDDTRGRGFSSSGVHFSVVHHTGSDGGDSDAYNRFLFNIGRPDVPPPLCNTAVDADGDGHIGCIGRANHAGDGSSTTYYKVLNESYDGFKSEIKPGPDDMNGNYRSYGSEVKFDGSHPMTPKQYDTSVRIQAAICDHHGWSALSVIGHKEWSSRKPDPGNTNMAKFRRDVQALLDAGPDGVVGQEEDELSAQDVKKILDAIGDVPKKVGDLRIQIQPEVDRWLWGSKASKPVNRRLVWVVNRLMNGLVTVNGRSLRNAQAISDLAQLVTNRTLTDSQREALVQRIEDAAHEGAVTGAAQVNAEDVAEQLEVRPKE